MKKLLSFVIALVAAVTLCAQNMKMPAFFTDGMVLQRNQPIPVWGWANPGSKVTVTFAGKKVKTKVEKDGSWKLYLPKLKANSKPQTMSIFFEVEEESYNRYEKDINDILVGDVFLCSGQSNMELPIRRCMDKVADLVKGYSNDQIRYLKLPHQFNYNRPNTDCRINGKTWVSINEQSTPEISAICYFMARQLQKQQNVPIGIINSAVGGTDVQAWMPEDVLKTFPKYEHEFEQPKHTQVNWTDSINYVEQSYARAWDQALYNNQPAAYADSNFSTVDIFTDWAKNRHGLFYFRKKVSLPASFAGKPAVIRLGAMKDADSVFVNGSFVGTTSYEYPPRIYNIKEGILREGENNIEIHLAAQGGNANFTSGKLYQIESGNEVVTLDSKWQMAFIHESKPRPSSTYFVNCPAALYNAMIYPLQDYAIAGMLWYQGENNAGQTDYADYLVAMVNSWRTQWKNEFPVVVMELASFQKDHNPPLEANWASLRKQQLEATQRLTRAALAPLADTGEWNDIHPQDKNIAGERAAEKMTKLLYKK